MRRRSLLARAGLLMLAGLGQTRALAETPADVRDRLGKQWQLPRGSQIDVSLHQTGMSLFKVLIAVGDWTIPPGTRLTIRLQDGIHEMDGVAELNHPQGDRVAIIGNTVAPAKCRIVWGQPQDLFYAPAGGRIGLIDGITIAHTRVATRGHGSAFLADNGGFIRCGTNLVVEDFYYGFQARYGGVIDCTGAIVRGGGDANFFAFNGGHLKAHGSRAFGARDEASRLGSGYVAEYGGTIDAANSIASENALAGFVALSNGTIRAYDSIAERNGRMGYYANTGGVIVAHRAAARLNCEADVHVGFQSAVVDGEGQMRGEKGVPDRRTCAKLRFR